MSRLQILIGLCTLDLGFIKALLFPKEYNRSYITGWRGIYHLYNIYSIQLVRGRSGSRLLKVGGHFGALDSVQSSHITISFGPFSLQLMACYRKGGTTPSFGVRCLSL